MAGNASVPAIVNGTAMYQAPEWEHRDPLDQRQLRQHHHNALDPSTPTRHNGSPRLDQRTCFGNARDAIENVLDEAGGSQVE